MTKNDFLLELMDIMMLDEELDVATELEGLDAYDSLARLAILSLFEDQLGKQIETTDLTELKTVGEMLVLAGLDQ